MILSVSRRTDIPAHYADWFFRRLKEGYVCTHNPMNPKQVSRIKLSPDTVDGIVFWTKNPAPMLDLLPELEGYPYYFQVTMTPTARIWSRSSRQKGVLLDTADEPVYRITLVRQKDS